MGDDVERSPAHLHYGSMQEQDQIWLGGCVPTQVHYGSAHEKRQTPTHQSSIEIVGDAS
jgi:hypothetical protein